jgi:uncharacterized protein
VRVVLDTNVLVSALLGSRSPAAQIYDAWKKGLFELATSRDQLLELARVLEYPKIRERMPVHLAARMLKDLEALAHVARRLPVVRVCRDPDDNRILAAASAAKAAFIVTGDKDLLVLGEFGGAAIVSIARFMAALPVGG